MRNDDIICVATSNLLLFYSYNLDDCGKNDIKKLQAKGNSINKGVYKKLQEFKINSQSICGMCHQNTIVSPYILYAGSDRSVTLYNADENTEVDKVILHSNYIHSIGMFAPSQYHRCDVAYNLFYTCSLDNTFKVWDVRTLSPFTEFTSHLNQCDYYQFR